MRANRKRRLWVVVLLIAAAAVAAGLVTWALSRNMNYLFTPSQVAAGEADGYTTFRLGGMVKAGSVVRAPDSLRIDFVVIDDTGEMPVEYTGIAPDLFRDNQSVIATGQMQGKRFIATDLLAKHDETYMPKELKDAMDQAHTNRGIPDANQ